MTQPVGAAQQPSDYMVQLLRLGQTLNSSLDLKQVLETAIGQVISFVGAERGFILLVEVETGRVWGEALRGIEKEALEATLSDQEGSNAAEISRTLVESVLDTRQPVISHNAMEDPRFSDRTSVQLAHLRSVLCVPLLAQSRVLGVIYLDSRVRNGVFSDNQLSMLSAFGNQASVAIENARLYENLRRSLEDRLRLQDELHSRETQNLALEEAARLKTEFVGYVAHELRNPLAAIRGYAQTLLTDPENRLDAATRAEFLESIEGDSDRLLDMIQELLEVSRIEAGRALTLHSQSISVRTVIDRQISRYTQYQYLTAAHSINLHLEESLPDIVADEVKIGQIVGNLLSNAIKYSPDGGEVEIAASRHGDSIISINVTDHGLGMTPDQVARLFRPYERLERPEIERIPGTGLGLYLVKHLVELHGGRIDCTSAVGEGTTFTVLLPISPGATAADAAR